MCSSLLRAFFFKTKQQYFARNISWVLQTGFFLSFSVSLLPGSSRQRYRGVSSSHCSEGWIALRDRKQNPATKFWAPSQILSLLNESGGYDWEEISPSAEVCFAICPLWKGAEAKAGCWGGEMHWWLLNQVGQGEKRHLQACWWGQKSCFSAPLDTDFSRHGFSKTWLEAVTL